MKNIKDKNNYLVLYVPCVLMLVTMCYFGINYMLKGTNAAFGNGCLTACMNADILVKYLPNYPDDFYSVDTIEKMTCSKYIIDKNMFVVPRGYEFVAWNTESDGSGDNYVESSCVTLSDDITLYALWKKKVIDYGDLNLDGNINNDDYLLLEKHLNEEILLNEELLNSADVNDDGNIDEIDLDIIKHVNLRTGGYIGYLPKEIVPIYELYKIDKDNNTSVMGPGSNGHVSGNGTGSVGSVSSSTGNGGNNTKPNVGTNKPNNNIIDDKKEDIESKTYNFKFIVDDLVYDNTSCTTKNSNNCKLVLPKIEPSKKGYKFNGWNVDKTCPNNVGINYSILLEDDATYYACFLEIEEENNIYGIILVGLLIFLVWILSIFGIITLINRFKKMSIED